MNKPTQIVSGEHADGSKFSEAKLLSVNSSSNLSVLIDIAFTGDAEAAKELHQMAVGCISALDELCHASPELLEPVARKTSFWPGWLSCDADIKKRGEELLEKLKLGRDAGLNYSGRQWTRETKETAVALQLYGMVQLQWTGWQNREASAKQMRKSWQRRNKALGRPANYRPARTPIKRDPKTAKEFELYRESEELMKNLQPLNRVNYKDWYKAALPTFIARYGEDFENRKCFSRHWKARVFFDNDPQRPGKLKIKSNARALIRDAIKKQIKLAFRSLAPKVG